MWAEHMVSVFAFDSRGQRVKWYSKDFFDENRKELIG